MNKWSVAVAALLMLAACGGAQAPKSPVGQLSASQSRAAGPPASFADTDPHPWGARSPADYPVKGIDVSRFQGPIDWPAVAASGVGFAFVKATEGGDRVDPFYRDNIKSARRAGVPAGPYHFFYHCRPADEQARWFIKHAPRLPGALPPVLDIEWTPTSPTCTVRRDAATIRDEMATFLRIVGAHYGQRPVIYATLDFFHDNDLARLGPQDFWLRSVAAHPGQTYPGQPWTFWQHTSTGLVPGITGVADINAFAGSAEAWQAWLAARQQ